MRENARKVIEMFADERNCNVIVLIGQDVSEERVSRDIAIFSTLRNQLTNDVSLLFSTIIILNLSRRIHTSFYFIYFIR